MSAGQPNKYFENAVLTASPAQLLIMLCDGAIKFCKKAIEEIQKKDYIEANIHLCRVQDIVNEFIITLDKESPVADSLLRLYDYYLYRLQEANVKKNIPMIEEMIRHFTELKQTWTEAALIVKRSSENSGMAAGGHRV